jgi:hypothetical protein
MTPVNNRFSNNYYNMSQQTAVAINHLSTRNHFQQEQTMRNNDEHNITVRIKFAWTSIVSDYVMNSNVNILTFIENLRQHISEEFHLDSNMYHLVCLDNEPYQRDSTETGEPFVPYSTAIHADNYFRKSDIFFYIRYLTGNELALIHPQEQLQSQNVVPVSQVIPIDIPLCVICYETEHSITAAYGCTHCVCETCFVRWQVSCPICRRSPTSTSRII